LLASPLTCPAAATCLNYQPAAASLEKQEKHSLVQQNSLS